MSLRTNLLKIKTLRDSPQLTKFFMNRVFWYTGTPWSSLTPVALPDYLPDLYDKAPAIVVRRALQRTLNTSMELDELCVLLTLVKYYESERVFELGTWDGNTTLNLAANLGENGTVVTLDLPPDPPTASPLLKPGEKLNVTPRKHVGEQFKDDPLASRITQVYGDSAQMDWTKIGEPFDFVFLDGCHTSAYVHSDTKNALKHLKPGGLIVWHDVDGSGPGIVVSSYYKKGFPIVWLAGTRLGVWRVENPAAAGKSLSELTF